MSLSEQQTPPAQTHRAPTGAPAVHPASRSIRRRRTWRVQARAAAAVVAGRASGAIARRLRLGGGTSLPGLVARRIDPDIATYLGAQLQHGSAVITGTNGKTTTSGLVAYVLRAAGRRVWRNREGANLMRGVTAALIIRARPNGMLRRKGNAAAVFEVDEAAFPQVVAEVQPRVIAVTNLFRDQLDRYGEVDTVAERWRSALATLSPATHLVLNADDPTVAALARSDEQVTHALYFGVQEAMSTQTATPAGDAAAGVIEVVDTRTCARCGAPLDFTLRFYSHIGHWSCPSCGYTRPRPQIAARAISADGLSAMHFTLVTPEGERQVRINLPGLYNVYNALAAAAVGYAMGVDLSSTATALERFTPAFGRAERIEANGRTVHLLLAKNPTGLNEVLRALAATKSPTRQPHLLLLLNDRAADGEDVSWIWDADLEQVAGFGANISVGGTRAYDLALRLKYAGAPAQYIEPDIPHALAWALEHTPESETLYIVPTYTALLAVRGELERQGFAPHYWEQQDA